MEKHVYSASALAKPASNCTSMTDRSTLLAVEVGVADEQIGESRVGMLGQRAWGFRTIAWTGGAFFVGSVIGALASEWPFAAKSQISHSVNRLQEVDLEEQLGHLPRRQERFRDIICPFLSTLVNEGTLPVQNSYTAEELRNVALLAGLPADRVDPHIAGHFQNNPLGVQDIFSMEGASNEHLTSTGVHDCPTLYFNCFATDNISFNHLERMIQVIGNQTWSCSSKTFQCDLPNEQRFDTFFSEIDTNQDGVMTRAELLNATVGGIAGPASSPEVSFHTQNVSYIDVNPISLGDVRGSHGLIMDIFGEPCADGSPCTERGLPDTISKERLRTVFIDRVFPEAYVFGIPWDPTPEPTASPISDPLATPSPDPPAIRRRRSTRSTSDPLATPSSTGDSPATPSPTGDPPATPRSAGDPPATPSPTSDPPATPSPTSDLPATVRSASSPPAKTGSTGDPLATPNPTGDPPATPSPTVVPIFIQGAILSLKSVRSDFYLHVSSKSAKDGDPVFHTDSTTGGSLWQVNLAGCSGSIVMLKSVHSGFYLHVADESKSDGDPVVHKDSKSEGSKWQVEVEKGGSSDTMVTLKSVRSGFYLHVSARSESSGDPVFQADSATNGSKWLLGARVM